MKKVSIITLQYINNYGSVLQTLATQQFFEDIGYMAEVVDYTRDNCKIEELKKTTMRKYISRGGIFSFKPILSLLLKIWEVDYIKKCRIFDDFRNKNIHMSEKYENCEELYAHPPIADIYCTGSDQVWNDKYNGGILPEYFLEYAPQGKRRIALSASFGQTKIDVKSNALMVELLKKYDAISVREDTAVDVLKAVGIDNAVHVLDPTLLLNRDQWEEKLRIIKIVSQKYVLIYQLNHNKEMETFADKLARKKGLKLIIISSSAKAFLLGGKVYARPTVEQFLSLIKHAEYVITDSFHGTAFSINFAKQLYVFYPPTYSTRLNSILKLIGYENHAIKIVKEFDFENLDTIDYESVDRIIEMERNKTKAFVLESIANEK